MKVINYQLIMLDKIVKQVNFTVLFRTNDYVATGTILRKYTYRLTLSKFLCILERAGAGQASDEDQGG